MGVKISIITVCYNSIATLEKTLQSVQNQDYKHLEYIVVDGGSTDGSIELIKKYDSIVDHFITEPDKGLYDAMNKGVQLATGDFIGIINSDDTFYENTTLSKVASFLKENPTIDASIGNIIQHKGDHKVIRTYNSKNWYPEKLKIGFMPPHPSIFFKNELFDKFGLYKLDFKIAADYELITRFFLKEEIEWKFSGITTTSMLMGGVSSSGFESYKKVTEEIFKSLDNNQLRYSTLKVRLRFFWKIFGLIKKN